MTPGTVYSIRYTQATYYNHSGYHPTPCHASLESSNCTFPSFSGSSLNDLVLLFPLCCSFLTEFLSAIHNCWHRLLFQETLFSLSSLHSSLSTLAVKLNLSGADAENWTKSKDTSQVNDALSIDTASPITSLYKVYKTVLQSPPFPLTPILPLTPLNILHFQTVYGQKQNSPLQCHDLSNMV